MLIEWLLAAAVLAASLALLPRLLRGTRGATRKTRGSGLVIAFGMAFAMIFDPKAVAATEQIARRNEIEDDDAESGDRPLP